MSGGLTSWDGRDIIRLDPLLVGIENIRSQKIYGRALDPVRVRSIESVTARNVHQIHGIFIDQGREERVFR